MGRAGSAAYKFVSAVSAEIVDGTPLLNRLAARDLCHPPTAQWSFDIVHRHTEPIRRRAPIESAAALHGSGRVQ